MKRSTSFYTYKTYFMPKGCFIFHTPQVCFIATTKKIAHYCERLFFVVAGEGLEPTTSGL